MSKHTQYLKLEIYKLTSYLLLILNKKWASLFNNSHYTRQWKTILFYTSSINEWFDQFFFSFTSKYNFSPFLKKNEVIELEQKLKNSSI